MTSHRAQSVYGSDAPNFGTGTPPTEPETSVAPQTPTTSQTPTAQQAAETAQAGKDAAADVAQHGKQAATDVAQHGRQAATEVAQHGKDAATDVASTATDAAKDVAHETKDQARDLLGKTKIQLDQQVRSQQESLVESLRSLGEQLSEMTEHVEHRGTAVDLAAQGRDRANRAADWLDSREPADVLDELRRVGRNHPGTFLLGAVAAGVVAGRLTRGAVDARSDGVHSAAAGFDHETSQP